MMENDLFEFPKKLGNDIESFRFYYSKKFPKIKDKYIEIIKKYYNDPKNFREFCLEKSQFLLAIAQKFVEHNANMENVTDLKKLTQIDQKMNKLSCFNFWVYNYALCEGPLQEFHLNKIKEFAAKIAEGDDVEEREKETEKIEHILIQTDYTDFYVDNLLRSLRIQEELTKLPELEQIANKLKELISQKTDYKEINKVIEDLLETVRKERGRYGALYNEFVPLIKVCEIQKSLMPLYSVVMTCFQYKNKALEYKEKYKKLKQKIENTFHRAKQKLSEAEYVQLEKSYQMLRLLAECKDLFGESDTIILPFWYKLIGIIAEKLGDPKLALGPGSAYYSFGWHVPGELKDIIYTIDDSDFDENELFLA